MAKPAKHAAPARLESGWADLAEGRWAAARSAFEEALEDDETPEAWEGLSWAAWWLDDAEALFAARERAYRLYRKRGDAGGAARMATWLASDQLDFHGAAAVASGWLAPHRLLDPLEADAEALPFGDWEFDVVTSSFGAIFAPDHQAVAGELLRVCRPGGTIGLLTFTPEGLPADFFGLFARYAPPPPPGALPPLLWGSEEHVRELFARGVESLDLTRHEYVERAASPEDYVKLFDETFGPVIAVRALVAAEPDRAAALDREFDEFARRANRGAPGGPAEYPYEYLLVVALKRGE